MLDYLIANDFSWQSAKVSHVVLLCRKKLGDISDWSHTDKIDKVRRANAHGHNVPNNLVILQNRELLHGCWDQR